MIDVTYYPSQNILSQERVMIFDPRTSTYYVLKSSMYVNPRKFPTTGLIFVDDRITTTTKTRNTKHDD